MKSLITVLTALAFIQPEIGYRGGMNYIVAALYFHLKDEELTFDLFLSLIV